ncbi:hemerythrin domain-containing protein [Ramlibacter sp. RBP-2]|uniref:Hemerythrin domain-containing protein n=1 Tax=Ramlibacter lithotrophicus TaxID=2606681 RepID=A0A7X6I4T7_9BURK|nr:hemerythrin domain-containing protein [Ramlibacter lithotrophicus]NKE64613.1 hemerythrin domain-containing protein [Ramlibacter lithotrophicus]
MPTLVQHDACELLDADHIATKHLFVEYARLAFAGAATGAGAPGKGRSRPADQRPALARKICRELTVHAQIEEEIFYPALRDVVDVPELLDEAQAEHQQARELIAQIEGLSEADAAMDDLVSELARAVENHVKEERDLLFPKARAAEELDLDELGARMKERQQELEAQAA